MEIPGTESETFGGKYHFEIVASSSRHKPWKSKFHLLLKNPSTVLTSRNKLTRPLRAELEQWAQSLEKLLTYHSGVLAFQGFLKSEFCEENIEFWLACEDLKQIKTSENLVIKTQSIYEEFIKKDSPKEVNLDFHTRSCIIQHLQQPTLNCFDEAQRKIYHLMENDSYPRFLQSDIYKGLRASVGL